MKDILSWKMSITRLAYRLSHNRHFDIDLSMHTAGLHQAIVSIY